MRHRLRELRECSFVEQAQLVYVHVELTGCDCILVVLEMHDVRDSEAADDRVHEASDIFARRPGVDERRAFAVAESSGSRALVDGRGGKERSANELDCRGVAGDTDAAVVAEIDEPIREIEDVDRAVAGEVVVVDEENVHAETRSSRGTRTGAAPSARREYGSPARNVFRQTS